MKREKRPPATDTHLTREALTDSIAQGFEAFDRGQPLSSLPTDMSRTSAAKRVGWRRAQSRQMRDDQLGVRRSTRGGETVTVAP